MGILRLAAAVAVLALLSRAADTTAPIEEVVRTVEPERAAGILFEPFTIVRLPALPLSGPAAWHRLRAPVPRLWLNGSPVTPNAEGDFDLTFLTPRGANTVVLPGWPADKPTVISTPRVYVAGERIERNAATGEVKAAVAVRNSLENTVNIVVSLTLARESADPPVEAGATVPPGVTQMVQLTGRIASPGAGAGASAGAWRIVLEKQEEAMEGGYRFVRLANLGSGPSVNSSGKP